ncbi:MAG: CDC27 family protein [Campylobacterales bacterium]|nr:CDC27 family protein [Campylobacterales bacterium]
MRNIHELERQWIRYKIRSYAPWIITPITLLTLGIVGYLMVPSQADLSSSVLPTPESIEQTPLSNSVAAASSSSVPAVSIPPSLAPEATVATFASPVLTPSLNFIERLNQKSVSSASSVLITSPSQESSSSDNHSKTIIQPSVDLSKVSEQQHILTIGTNRDDNDIEEVISRFKTNKKPALSLFVAKRYYAMRQYHDAYNYALITNELDSENEESWLIAAKALVKLGDKEKAMHLLNKFIARSDSVRAKMVLAQIENGTLE